MNKSKYYRTLGTLIETSLASVLEDIIGLDDIPEVESHRLAELCRMLNVLEGLFIEDDAEVRLCSYHPYHQA
jgi:protein transport protein DSL1/ZW10